MIRISDAEFEVMKVIWKRKEATSLEIIEDVKDFKWNPNTVRTLIKRLEKKGAIEVVSKIGKSYKYASLVDENKYKFEMTKDLIKRLYDNSLTEFLLDYCAGTKLDPEEVRKINETIRAKEERNRKERK